MKQHNVAKWLKAACIGAAILGILVFAVEAPILARVSALAFPRFAGLRVPALVWVWGICVLCYLSLWRFWGVCIRIGEDRSFSPENVAAMKHIANYLRIAASMTAALALLLYGLKLWAGANLVRGNLWLLALLACFFAGVALLSQALSLLLNKAVILQQDKDLTI